MMQRAAWLVPFVSAAWLPAVMACSGDGSSSPASGTAGGSGGKVDADSTGDTGGVVDAGSTGDTGGVVDATAEGTDMEAGGEPRTVVFATQTLSNEHYAEGADVGDINGDGIVDLVAGPHWYAGPDFERGGQLFDAPSFSRDQYSTFFLTFVDDLNDDQQPDVIAIGDPGAGMNAVWYENPGPSNLQQDWAKHLLFESASNESPMYADLVGDAKKELVLMTNGRLGYARAGAIATEPWSFHPISDAIFNTPFVHGLGVGDINGDGLNDVVERTGDWLQVANGEDEPSWERRDVDFGAGLPGTRPGNWGGAQMLVFDVDGDGDSDVITALAAHHYGISWFEQNRGGFVPHEILAPIATEPSFSQPHALVAADVNGDGLLDFLSGKRYYAHPSTSPDPGTDDPAVLYWFELQRSAQGAAFIPHLIHADSGAGLVFTARDLTRDGKVDVFVTNKRGTFLHVQQ